MPSDMLIERLEKAVAQAEFTDVYRNRFGSSAMRHVYESKQRCSLSSTDGIRVHQRELEGLTSELDSLLGSYISPNSASVGNSLYWLTGSLASPRLPSCEEYAKTLVLAASRIGAGRVAKLVSGWIQGKGIRVSSCVLLKGLKTEGKLRPVEGMRLDTLSNNGDHLPRSLRLDPREHMHEQFVARAMLSLEYDTVPGLHDPEVEQQNVPLASLPHDLVNPDLSTVSFDSFCRAVSLEMNNHVDWFISWNDYGNVEAFFLNPGFSSRRKEALDSSVVSVSEEEVRRCLHSHALLHGFRALDLPIARWQKSKRSLTTYEQLIELRIALESILLSEDKGKGEKRHRLATRGAWFLGKTVEKRKSYFDTLRYVYDYASSVIHGGTPKVKSERDLAQDIGAAQNLCRDAIMRVAEARRMPDWSDLILGGGNSNELELGRPARGQSDGK